jgi:nucleoside-diphosphate-sugar epimerase
VDGESVAQCLHLMSGVMWPYAARIGMGVVDVRDVARAHVAALEAPGASGRYLINAASEFLLVKAARVLRRAHPALWVPPGVGPSWGVRLFGPLMGLPRDLAGAMLDKLPAIDASKAARDLGMTPDSYVPVEQTVRDMAAALLERRMVPPFACPVVPLVTLCGLLVAGVVALAVALLARSLQGLV